MKKTFFSVMFAIALTMFMGSISSCKPTTQASDSTVVDTVKVDSVEVVDTIAADSAVVLDTLCTK